jgi:photosystem II stability/assembly factor-like uncharacterized protein
MKTISFLLLGLALSMAGYAQDWVSLNSGTSNHLNSICFPDTNIGYAVGDSGTILKTMDGGEHWVAQNSGTSYRLNSVRFYYADTGYIAGYNYYAGYFERIILKTVDGGLNWIPQNIDTNEYYWEIQFLSPDTIFIDNGQSILKTMDNGLNWTTITKPENGVVWACKSNIIYMVGGYGDYFKTTDGGDNWVNQLSSYIPGGGIYDICFSNNNNGIAVGGGFSQGISYEALYYTRDGGDPWARASSYSSDKWFYSVFFTDDTTAYAVGSGGVIIKTTDTGEHYTELSSGTSNDLNAVYFANSMTGYIAGNNGTILKTASGPLGLAGTSSSNGIATIYPNPFKDNLSVEIDKMFNIGSTSLEIYNAFGILLFEQEVNAHHTVLDLQTLIPGIYFLKITSPGHQFVRKLIKDQNP